MHCEFLEEPVCDLKCFNKGECKNGVKDYKGVLSVNLQDHFKGDNTHNTHCICPQGFTGRQCGIDISTCGDSHCLNGGVCGENGTCDCTVAIKGEIEYAGTSCEVQVSTFCEVPSGYDPMEFFCTNNGKCPEKE